MKLHIQHRLAEACISWGDYLRLGAVSFLQLQQESYACTLEAQPEYLLLYVKEGTMYLVRNRVEAMYSAGSLLLLPPEEEYRLHFAREKQASAYWLSFSGFSITKLLVDSGLMNQPVFHTPPDCDLSYLFEGILRQSLPSPADPRTVSLNSMGLFMQLLAAIVPHTKPAQPKPTPEKIIECECTTKALAYAVHLIQDDIAALLDEGVDAQPANEHLAFHPHIQNTGGILPAGVSNALAHRACQRSFAGHRSARERNRPAHRLSEPDVFLLHLQKTHRHDPAGIPGKVLAGVINKKASGNSEAFLFI